MNQHPPYKRIVVTGLGVISPNGEGKNAFTQAIHQGIPGTRPIQSFECNGLKSRVAGEIPHFKPPPCVRERDLHRLSRCALLAIAAGKEALEDAGLQVDEMPMEERQSFGVVLGTGGGSVDFIESQYSHYFSGQLKRASAFNISASTMGTLSSELSITFGLHGLSHVVTTGCTSSTDAIGHAADLIRMGRATRILTGGADAAITHSTMTGFCIMGVVSTHFNETPERASRPFNKDRDGFVLGEGAWMIMLERLDAALERGARIYAELLGYGSTCDAYHTVRLDPEAREPARAMQLALEESALAIDEIGYVNLHGTSTQLNDRIETIAMRRFLNSRAHQVPMSALKSMIGHPQGACGAAGIAATLLAMQGGFIPPTINYEVPDPDCDLDYVPNQPRRQAFDAALCNCIAFGSKNSALIFGRYG